MIAEKEMQTSLEALVNSLIERSAFFKAWIPDRVSIELSQKFLISFDSLVKTFPSLIAAGAARTADETTRMVLAVNLYQESGEGDITRTHHAIYRKYLTTAGISLYSLSENSFAAEWRTHLSEYVNQTESTGSMLGALAAGEFLAQPALSRIYEVLKPQYPQADQEYFTKHLVLEEEHVKEITAMMVREAKNNQGWQEVLDGFNFGLSVWETYFNHLAEYIAVIA